MWMPENYSVKKCHLLFEGPFGLSSRMTAPSGKPGKFHREVAEFHIPWKVSKVKMPWNVTLSTILFKLHRSTIPRKEQRSCTVEQEFEPWTLGQNNHWTMTLLNFYGGAKNAMKICSTIKNTQEISKTVIKIVKKIKWPLELYYCG